MIPRCLFALIGLAMSAVAADPLNVVVLYGDDCRHDTLGIAGHPIVQTPHIDRLARSGVRFTHS